ncbi:MAG: hypothetical protein E7631_06050 [Ruminococcaceae bacterium]|nr:hypothetical protein [Oscillospiraceae bacterium]
MKKFLSALLCGLLVILCVAPAAASDYYATATNGTIVVDGQIDEAWATAEAFTANALKDGTEEGITTEWKAMWDNDNLYILAVVTGDKDHFTSSQQSWGDGIELYFDILNSDAGDYATDDAIIQFGWHKDDLAFTAFKGTEQGIVNSDGTYEIVCVENDNGYIYEFSFNAVKFCKNFTMKEGAVVGFEIQVNSKNAEGDGRTSAYGWADPDNAAWQYPYLMGDLELVAAPVVETVVEEATAPQTFDMGVIAAVAAVVSAAGYVISKKR